MIKVSIAVTGVGKYTTGKFTTGQTETSDNAPLVKLEQLSCCVILFARDHTHAHHLVRMATFEKSMLTVTWWWLLVMNCPRLWGWGKGWGWGGCLLFSVANCPVNCSVVYWWRIVCTLQSHTWGHDSRTCPITPFPMSTRHPRTWSPTSSSSITPGPWT